MATGLNAIESFLKGGGGGGGSTSGRYLSYFILGDGESKIIRFLTDIEDCHRTKFYEFVLDKNGKFQNFVVAPEFYADNPTWHGEDWVKKFGGMTTDYTTKEPVAPTPRERIVGLAVEREEYQADVDGRRVIRTHDMLAQFEGRDGKMYDSRNFLIVKQSKAFWNTLIQYYHEFGTICDRDYKVTRNGTGRDIVYSIIPKNQDEGWNNDGSSLAALRAQYGYGTGRDMDGNEIGPDSDERFLYCTQTLNDWLENQASEERARAALVAEGVTIESSHQSQGPAWSNSAPDEPQAAAAPAANGTDVSSLRARLERHR